MFPRGSPRARFWPIRALVVDDHRPPRDLLRGRLRSLGIIDAWEADDGEVFRRARQRGATEVLTRRAVARDLDHHLRKIVGIGVPA